MQSAPQDKRRIAHHAFEEVWITLAACIWLRARNKSRKIAAQSPYLYPRSPACPASRICAPLARMRSIIFSRFARVKSISMSLSISFAPSSRMTSFGVLREHGLKPSKSHLRRVSGNAGVENHGVVPIGPQSPLKNGRKSFLCL